MKPVPLEPDLTQANRFLRLLDPDAGAFTFQTIPEAPSAKGSATVLHGTLDEVADRLVKLNRRGHGIFVATQRMDGNGRRADNLERIRCHWLDVDGRAGQKLPRRWRHETKRGLCPPPIIVETSPGSYHVWWPLKDEPDRQMWAGVQRRLLKDMKSDPAGNTDVSKVLRLPGFLHQKTEPHLVRMVVSGRGRYSVADMVEVYIPIAPPTKPSPNTVKARSATPADLLMVRSALKFLSSVAHPGVKRLPVKHGGGASKSYADHYETWVKFGLAIYRAFADDGFAVWHEWSKSSRAYPGAKGCERSGKPAFALYL